MTAYVLVVLATVLALPLWVWGGRGVSRRLAGVVLAVIGGLAAVATLFGGRVDGDSGRVLVLLAMVLAVCGGAVVTLGAFEQIDATRSDTQPTLAVAAQVLRGGAWIGALERVAVFATLAARWPEGVAVVLAVKGLGRYPELRSKQGRGTTERFIIGTMISIVWAALCIYLAFGPYELGPSTR